MKRTSTRLADGRELIYFDDSPDPHRVLEDPRDLPQVSSTSEVRWDVLTGEWVGLAGHRQSRTYLPPTDECPLCPSRDGKHTEVPSPDYDVVVFENRFPSFEKDAQLVETDAHFPGPGLFDRRPGRGRCEVVAFTSDHSASFADLSASRVRTVVDAWADRTAALLQMPEVQQVFCFENRGEEIGVTLGHPHGQIYGYPFLTPRTQRMLGQAAAFRGATGGNLFEAIVEAERKAGTRMVAESAHWVAYVPAAARWPFEVHIHPLRRVPDLTELSAEQRDDFATVYLEVLRRFDGLFDLKLPYISAWHQAPKDSVRAREAGGKDRSAFGAHLQLFSIRRAPGKLKYLAGSESGMGVFVNDVPPEQAAAMLRAVQLADPAAGAGA